LSLETRNQQYNTSGIGSQGNEREPIKNMHVRMQSTQLYLDV